jgi:hypothetical protein
MFNLHSNIWSIMRGLWFSAIIYQILTSITVTMHKSNSHPQSIPDQELQLRTNTKVIYTFVAKAQHRTLKQQVFLK